MKIVSRIVLLDQKSTKSGLPFITFGNADQMIGMTEVQSGINASFTGGGE